MPVQRITKRTVDAAELAAASYLIRDANLKASASSSRRPAASPMRSITAPGTGGTRSSAAS